MQGRKAQSSLDSLLDQEQSVSWNTSNSSTFSLSNRAKSNSLPKSAFGSLQLKGTHYFSFNILQYGYHNPYCFSVTQMLTILCISFCGTVTVCIITEQ